MDAYHTTLAYKLLTYIKSSFRLSIVDVTREKDKKEGDKQKKILENILNVIHC